MTPRQKQVLDLVREGIEAKGIPPTYEAIKAAMGLKSRANVHAFVERLVAAGHLVRRPGHSHILGLPDVDLGGVATSKLVAELESRGWRKAA